jgi:hypothetical protein
VRRRCRRSYRRRLHRREHACQVFAGNRVHIGERALALKLDLRWHRAVTSCLSSNLRISFVTFVLSLSIAVAREWPSRREIVQRPWRHQATPLRSVPSGLAGLTAPRLRRRSGNYVMATGRSRTCSALEIERCTLLREPGRSAIGVLDAQREERRRGIIATSRCECSFAHSLGKLLARCSRESCERDDRSEPR